MTGKWRCLCGGIAFLCASLNGMNIQLNESPRTGAMPRYLKSVAGKKIISLQHADFLCRTASCYNDKPAVQLSCYKVAQKLIDYGTRLNVLTLDGKEEFQPVEHEDGRSLEQSTNAQIYCFRLLHLANLFKLSEQIERITRQLIDLRERDKEKFKVCMNSLDVFKKEMKESQEGIEITLLLKGDTHLPDSPDDARMSDSEIFEDEQFFSFWVRIEPMEIL